MTADVYGVTFTANREPDEHGVVVFAEQGRRHGGGEFIVKRDRRDRWRAYYREIHESSNAGGWGRIDYGIHVRDFALRSDETGNPLAPADSAEQAIDQATAALAAGTVMPYGGAS